MEISTIKSSHVIETKAIFSECMNYRYSLSRSVVTLNRKITFIMFNPNVRDDIRLGPTANYCFNYAVKKGYGKMELVNLFAFRSESIKKLKERVRYENVEPVGDLNNQYLIKAIKDADKVVVAWGSNGGFQRRDKAVLSLLKDIPLFCFNKTSKGKPEYPKRIMGVELIEF